MKRLIFLLLLLVPVSLIAKDVGWTINKNVNYELTISNVMPANQPVMYINSVKVESMNFQSIDVNTSPDIGNILLFDKAIKTIVPVYFKPPLDTIRSKYNQTHNYDPVLSGPELYYKRI